MSDAVSKGGAGLMGDGALIEKEKACDKWGKRVSESTMAAEKYDRVGDGGVWVGSGADSTET